ncbi:hypothetical protein [Rhodococcus zopfii]|uniref:hypothetical protein n=1 Tax=Rhodococcus zopfii TaxID=43772 RepID=UPI00352850AF
MLYLTYLIAMLTGPSAATGLFVGSAIAGAHRPERLGNRAVTVAQLMRPATLSTPTICPTSEFVGVNEKVDEPIPYLPVDRGEILDPEAPIGYELVHTAVAEVLVPAVTR